MATDLAKLNIEVRVDGVPESATRLRAVDQGIQSNRKATDALTSSFSGLTRVAAMVLAAFTALSSLTFARDAVMAASRYETLGISMVQAGKNAGYAAHEMLAFERQLQKNGIAMLESRQVLSRLSAANLDLSKSAELARAAQDLAVVGGTNSSEAFERLVHGVVSGQTEVLRTIGLMVNFESAYDRVAKTAGKTTAELTEAEKVQTRMNAALDAASKYTGIYERSMTTAGKQLGSLTRYVSDFQVLIGQVGLDAFAYSVFGVNDGLAAVNARLREMQDSGQLEAVSKGIGEGLRTVISHADKAAAALVVWKLASMAASSETLKLGAAVMNGNAVMLDGAKASAAKAQADHNAAVAAVRAAEAERHRAFAVAASAANSAEAMAAARALAGAENGVALANARAAATANALAVANSRATLASRTLAGAGSLASGLVSGLGRGLMGVVNMLGGPMVVGATVAATAVYSLATADSHAERTAKQYGVSLSGLNDQYERLSKLTLDAARNTDNLNAAQKAAAERTAQMQLDALRKEEEKLRSGIAGVRAYSTDMFGSVLGEKVFESQEIAEYNRRIQETIAQFRDGKLTAEQAAVAIGGMRKELAEIADRPGWFNKAADEAKVLAESAGVAEAMLGRLYEVLLKIANAPRIDRAAMSPDAFLGLKQRDEMAKLNEEAGKLYEKTRAGQRDALAAALDRARTLNDKLGSAQTGAILKDAQEALTKFDKAAAGGGAAKGAFQASEAYERLADATEQWRLKNAELLEQLRGAGLSSAMIKIERDYISQLDAIEKRERELISNRQQYAKSGKTDTYEKALLEIQAQKQLAQENRELNEQIARRADLEKTLRAQQNYASLIGDLRAMRQAEMDLLQVELQKTQNLAEQAAIRERIKEAEARRDGNILYGMKAGYRDYAASVSDSTRNMSTLIQNSFSGMEDALVEFTKTGKLNFSSLVDSIIADFTRMALRMAMFGNSGSGGLGGLLGSAIGAIGSMFSGGSAGSVGSAYSGSFVDMSTFIPTGHAGGVAGIHMTGSTFVSPHIFAGADRYHSGGVAGLKPGEVPAVLKHGEPIFTTAQASTLAPLSAVRESVFSALPRIMGGAPVQAGIQLIVNIENNAPVEVEAQESTDEEGNPRLDILIREVDRGLADLDAKGQSRFANVMEKRRGLSTDKQLYY